jgi:glutamate/tyrosine decarboxylase-like PLP-dependent enzyme
VNSEEFRGAGHAVVDAVADYLGGVPDGAVWTPVPEPRRRLLEQLPLADEPTGFADLLAFTQQHVMAHPFGNGHPRFFAWGNPAPAPEGVLFELIAAAMNPSCAGGDHAAIYLEAATVRWLAELLGYPGHGVLVSGGATAALTALAAARRWAARADGWDDRADGIAGPGGDLRLYVSDESHASQRKAAQLLGLGDARVRVVPTDPDGRMRIDGLDELLAADRAQGLRPFCVVASAGVVSTGVVDDLDAVAERCRRHGLWFHVDGSLGAFGRLDPAAAPLFAGMERADSIAVDPHKWLTVPIDCAAVLVRDLEHLRDTFSLVPPYLRGGPEDRPWYSEYVFDQTRPFRALKLWATVASAGRREIARRIQRGNALAARLEDQVRRSPRFELLSRRELQVVVFSAAGTGDEAVVQALERVRRAGDVFLTGTRIGDREAMRACFLNHDTSEADVDRILPAIEAALPPR